MKRVYVAGPMSANNILDVLDNIHQGIKAGAELIKAGFSPFVPHLDIAFKLQNGHDFDIPIKTYYEYTIQWLSVSDMMLVLDGWEHSVGTKAEIEKAKELNIPIYYSLQELIDKESDNTNEIVMSCLFKSADACIDILSKELNIDKQDITIQHINNSNDVEIKLPKKTITISSKDVLDVDSLCPISLDKLMEITGKTKEDLLCNDIPELLNTYKYSFVDGVLERV